MLRWTRLTAPVVALVLGACTPPPDEVTSAAEPGSSSGTSAGPTTTPQPTTMPGEDTVGTQGATGTDTTMGAVDTTVGASATESDTTMGVDPTVGSSGSSGGGSTSSGGGESSSSGPPPPPECVVPDDCDNNETCDVMGDCVPACNPWGDGDYGYCLTPLGTFDSAVLCGEPLTCINSGNPIQVVVCGRTCATLCDCPGPAATGNATVTCGDLVGGGSNECFLSCANSEMCPDGMDCRDGGGGLFYCTHPVQPLAMYGNCDDIAAPCMDGTCSTSGDNSVCVTLCPGGLGDCDAPPLGADLGSACNGVISPPMGNDCYLPCNGGGDCPNGMGCINTGIANMCMWP